MTPEHYAQILRDGRSCYRNFMLLAWRAQQPLLLGYHTRIIAAKLQLALCRYRRGESVHTIITLPFRHGKSDLASRYFPPFVLGVCPDAEIMLVAYAAALSESFSRDIQSIMRSGTYRALFPLTQIDARSRAVTRWGLSGRRGKLTPVGLGGAITGKGADVLIVDDYLKNRAEAESQSLRDKIWEAFTNDLLTRLAPVHICIIVATRWHADDLIGRIEQRMRADPAFPRFETLKFPARDEHYPSGILFPERFSRAWYDQQFAALGPYGSAALLQCEPIARGGNLLAVDNMQCCDTFSLPENIRSFRFWDLASSAKERLKNDPDYTVGIRVSLLENGTQKSLYIHDVRRMRCEAPERNRRILQTALEDGPSVVQGVESVAGYKDTFTLLRELLAGCATVRKINVSGDKVVRASVLEPFFESGRVFILRSACTDAFLSELAAFPAGVHDDQVDALSGAVHMALKNSGGAPLLFTAENFTAEI